MIFCLAKVLRPKKLRQTNDVGALFCCVANELDRMCEVFLRLGTALQLDECDFRCRCHSERSRGISNYSEAKARDVSTPIDMTTGIHSTSPTKQERYTRF